MELTIRSTSKIIETKGRKERLWQGITEKGILFTCFIDNIAVESEKSHEEFKELIPLKNACKEYPSFMNKLYL